MPELHEQLTSALADRYAIERQIGAGGMAVVYLARDLKHRRKVALKVLNPDLGVVLGADRFLSEIRVTANLQHPHLLPLFDSGEADGMLYYVMPYIEGESLRATLAREKQLPVEDALRITIAVASALDYAHRHGVIHRDLKPENILMHEGQPLVADFGIALAVSNAGGNRITQTGLSLGTPHYMSPEQATGDRVIDGRTDVYSLGAVSYEMLTGEPPHTGNTSQAIIARVLTEKPRSVRATRPNVPEHVEWAIEHALEKLSADRFTTAQEFADALQGRGVRTLAASGLGAAAPAGPRSRLHWRTALRHPVVLGVIAVVAAAGGMSSWLMSREARADADFPVRFELTVPEAHGAIGGTGTAFAFSPDGRLLAYRIVSPAGVVKLYLRRSDEALGREVPGTEGIVTFHFSPDGRWIAFQQDDQIKRIEVGGAAAILRISDYRGTAAKIAWAGDELVVGNLSGGLWKIPAGGGVRAAFTNIDSARGETRHRDPVVLADGETILFAIDKSDGPGTIGVTSVRAGTHVDLGVHGTSPLGVVAGLLVYHSGGGAILGVPFDAGARRVSGSPTPLLDGVSHLADGYAHAAVSRSGSIAYLAGGTSGFDRAMVAVGFDGSATPVAAALRRFSWPRYSPDGRRIVVAVTAVGTSALWIYDVASETLSPLTGATNATEANWSPDGKFVVYPSNRRGVWELYRQPVDGSAPPELIQPASSAGQPMQGVLTPDGRHLIYRLGARGFVDDLWYRALSGDTTSKPLAADSTFAERNPAISPDGRWVAYAANETRSFQAFQVYVRPFPGPGPRYAVTTDGGDAPVWSKDGRKIFYRVRGSRFEEASITFTPQFGATRRALFERNYLGDSWSRGWDLAPSGRSFLVVQPVGSDQRESAYVVHNWAAEVRARLSASR